VNKPVATIGDAASLANAIEQGVDKINILGVIADLKSISLPRGICLRGVSADAALHFKKGQPGLLLSADHMIEALRIWADDTQVAVGLADEADDLGTISISDITTVGRFHLEASLAKQGHIVLKNIHVEQADARLAAHRPAGFGVEVLLGGISIYNASKDSTSRWAVEARNLSGGRKDKPLRGSGVFIFGGWSIPTNADMTSAPAPTQKGSSIELTVLTTGEIYSDGGIPEGISNLITGAVFIGSGVDAKEVINEGPTTTYGPNDMVLDNWGKVQSWIAKADVKSLDSSGIGFVNFGDIDALKIDAPIETYGAGARGFNLYDGTLNSTEFASITTFGDGAIGVQLSKPFGTITVKQDVRTKGGEGDSLVKGKVVHLKANAVSLKKGAKGDAIIVHGNVVAEVQDIDDWEFEAPADTIGRIEVGGTALISPPTKE
jgi:hypothetical protein